MTDRVRTIQGKTLHREISIARRDINVDARTVDVAFSSDAPIERFFGIEILSHEPGAARLDRLNDGGALLMSHDARDWRAQVGVVENARIDSDGVGRAQVRFGEGAQADEVFRDVAGGIRQKLSVGYMIHAEEVTNGVGDVPTSFRVTDWEPLEISFVAIPADVNAHVGRAAGDPNPATGTIADGGMLPGIVAARSAMSPGLSSITEERTMDPNGTPQGSEDRDAGAAGPAAARTPVAAAVTTAIASGAIAPAAPAAPAPADRAEADAAIRLIGDQFDMPEQAEQHVTLGATEDQFRNFVLARLAAAAAVPLDVADGARIQVPGRHSVRPEIMRAFGHDLQTRERNAYTVGMWARAFILGDNTGRAARWCRDNLGERAMAGGIATKGGAVVPDELANAVIDLRETYGVARRLCDVVPMASDTLIVPRLTSHITAAWAGENVSLTDSDGAYDDVQLVARKLTALTKLSTEWAEDAVIDVGAALAKDQAWAFAKKEDEAWIDGDGTSTYGGIQGMRGKLIDGTHTAGATDAAGGEFSTVTADNLDSVRATLPEFADANPVWLASKAFKNIVFDGLTRAAGGNTMEMLGGERPVAAYLGDPIRVSQVMPKNPATDYDNLCMALYGDFSMGCVMGDRRGFRLQVLNELFAQADQVGIMSTERVDIVTHGLGDTSTGGPVVGLIGAT